MSPSIGRGFPVALVMLAVVAWQWPVPFAACGGAIVPLLMVVMLGMGLTLTAADFRAVLAAPRLVVVGVLLHYTVMPAAAWLLIGLPTPLCPLHVATGIHCPTCGGTRAAVSLLRGEL